jgi:predicted DNA-binding transcriptional regulator YafY
MYHPTTRVLTVLELLQSRARMSGPELANRLEVDVRTVRRYVLMLQELGIPVEGGRGRYGAYRLRPGYKLPPLMFAEDEALAVMLGLTTARRLGLAAAAPAVEGALAKIERVLPAQVRERLRAVQETLVMSIPADAIAAPSEVVVMLSLAARRQQRVWLRYRAWAGAESEREFDPYGLVHRAGRWYTVGHCHLRQGIRVFRLDRIQRVEPREAEFTRPADFETLEHVERAIANTPGAWHIEVLLRTSLAEARCWISPATATLEETSEGVLMRGYAEQLGWVAHLLAGLPCELVVRQPAELRDELRRLATRLERLANLIE